MIWWCICMPVDKCDAAIAVVQSVKTFVPSPNLNNSLSTPKLVGDNMGVLTSFQTPFADVKPSWLQSVSEYGVILMHFNSLKIISSVLAWTSALLF